MPTVRQEIRFEGIGTHWRIDLFEAVSPTFTQEILNEIQARIETFDRAYSRFREDSLVTKMSRAEGRYQLPSDAEPMFRLYQELYHLTEGLMTPLIGNLLVEAGYDARYSLEPKELHTPPFWEQAIVFEPPQTLVVKEPVVIDLGAMGKGYLIDLVSDLLWQRGLRSYCIDAGGDMLYRNPSPEGLPIGLEHPEHLEQAIGITTICNQSLCGSAGNRRVWGEFHHIMNPKTRSSPRELLAVWTVAKTTLLADAMSTALFFTSPEKLQTHYPFEYLLLFPNHTVQASPRFPVELFVPEES